ncbi:MAG: acyl carrier protein [Planctomycetes bacterium]|jgi:acyl carrier protein|nr:acyl carrier protein [Planctomycetota bacterium]
MAGEDALTARVKALIVRQLKLEAAPETLGDSTLLFGGELGLDSIDALELVVGLEKEFGVTITDPSVGEKVLRSVETIVGFLREKGLRA